MQWHKSPATTPDGSAFAWSDPPVCTEKNVSEGHEGPTLPIRWCIMIFILTRCKIQQHCIRLEPWQWHNSPQTTPDGSDLCQVIATSQHEDTWCWGHVRWTISIAWCRLLCIGPIWMMRHHCIGLEPWQWYHTPRFPTWWMSSSMFSAPVCMRIHVVCGHVSPVLVILV